MPASFILNSGFRLTEFRRAVDQYLAGTKTAPPTILCLGDSKTAGYGSAGATWTGAKALSYPRVLGPLLSPFTGRESSFFGTNVDPGSGSTPGLYDSRLVLNTGWSVSATSTIAGFYIVNNVNTTGAISFTPAEPFDRIVVYYATSGSNGSFSVNVDGGAALSTINTVGASGTAKATVSCTLGTHTVNITPTALSTSGIFFFGLDTYNTTVPAFSILNAGLGGTLVSAVAATGSFGSISAITTIAPDLTVIPLITNDANAGSNLTTYVTNLQSIINTCKLSGSVILVASSPSGTANFLLQGNAYISACRDLAQLNRVPFLNLFDTFISYANANAEGLMTDTNHESASGYAVVARLVAAAIARYI